MRIVKVILFALLATGYGTPLAANVSVTVNLGHPSYYGTIDTYGYPAPQLVYAQPVIVERRELAREPIYVRVPPGHAKHWEKHCRKYNACDRPVYFVRDEWYRNVYVPKYVEVHGRGHKNSVEKEHEKHERKEARRAAKQNKHGD